MCLLIDIFHRITSVTPVQSGSLVGIYKNLNVLGHSLGVIKFAESAYFCRQKTKWLWLFLFVLLRARKLASAHWLPWTTREVSSPCPPSNGARSGGESSNFHIAIKQFILLQHLNKFCVWNFRQSKGLTEHCYESISSGTLFLMCPNSILPLQLREVGMKHLRRHMCFMLMIMCN